MYKLNLNSEFQVRIVEAIERISVFLANACQQQSLHSSDRNKYHFVNWTTKVEIFLIKSVLFLSEMK